MVPLGVYGFFSCIMPFKFSVGFTGYDSRLQLVSIVTVTMWLRNFQHANRSHKHTKTCAIIRNICWKYSSFLGNILTVGKICKSICTRFCYKNIKLEQIVNEQIIGFTLRRIFKSNFEALVKEKLFNITWVAFGLNSKAYIFLTAQGFVIAPIYYSFH